MPPKCSPFIAHLIEVPHLVPVLERWFTRHWPAWYGPGGEGDAAADLAACACRSTLPLCLVALDDTGGLLGTAALKADSLGSDLAPGPWLAALLVAPRSRRRGVATALVAAIEAESRKLGFAALYASTDTAQGILGWRNWTAIGASRSPQGTIPVYKLTLA